MSPIHDHAGSSCWGKVLQGQLREVRYEETRAAVLALVADASDAAAAADCG